MLAKVISGGQTGVDLAALRAAAASNIPTGGYAARGWQTERGPAPWLAEFGLVECDRPGYPARTRANVGIVDGLLVLMAGGPVTGGTALTFRLASDRDLPYIARFDLPADMRGRVPDHVVPALARERAREVAGWLREFSGVLMIAGPRESKSPGIGVRAEAFLVDVFGMLRG